MLKIRLMRIGASKRPFYRVVAVDERKKRTGAYLDLLGTYNPLTEPKEIKLNQEKIDEWMKKGAQPSDGFLRIIGKAKQRLPRKPKKEKKAKAEAPAAEVKAEEAAIEETPVSTEEVNTEPVEETATTEEVTPEAPAENVSETPADAVSEAPADAVEPGTEEPKAEEAAKE